MQTLGLLFHADAMLELLDQARRIPATLLLEERTHPKIVQDLLGHSAIAMTLDLYSHVTPRLQEEATAKMQQLIFCDDPPRDLAPGLKRGSRH